MTDPKLVDFSWHDAQLVDRPAPGMAPSAGASEARAEARLFAPAPNLNPLRIGHHRRTMRSELSHGTMRSALTRRRGAWQQTTVAAETAAATRRLAAPPIVRSHGSGRGSRSSRGRQQLQPRRPSAGACLPLSVGSWRARR